MSYRVLVTPPPMVQIWGMLEELRHQFPAEYVLPDANYRGVDSELMELLPACDAWIVGNEDVNARVLQAGRQGRLRAVVRWGIGMG